MKKTILSFLLLMAVVKLSSQSYLFDSIPENLKKKADAVVRTEQCLYTIIDANHTREKVKTAVTLLNRKADYYRYQEISYDRDSKVIYFRGTIYDERGKIIKVLGLTDVRDMSAIPGGTFYSDSRMKFLYFPIYKYPYTIEFEYEKEYSSVYSYPTWYFQNNIGQSVQQSGIQFVVPEAVNIRFYTENLDHKVDSVITPYSRIYTWQEENIPAVTEQKYLPRITYPWPMVSAAPLDFYYGGYKGSFSSWKTFGDWNYNLIRGLDILPQSELTKISEITSGVSDIRTKTRLIYEYMQSRTRYISIQIGIGGCRPADAATVSKCGYGDCKALVNYTMALLKAAGITSYYTLVKSGPDGKLPANFIDDQFDHIILCVPMPKDTVWLECTNQTLPFNNLGDFTEDRLVLLITPDGGKLVRTPAFGKDENVCKRIGSVYLNNFGKSSARLTNYYSGVNYYPASGTFSLASDDEMKRYLRESMRFSDIKPSQVKFSEKRCEKPSATLIYDIDINDFATMTGQLITFNPVLDEQEYLQDLPVTIDIQDHNISYDSITYNLPLGYKVESRPADVLLQTGFGKFSYRLDDKGDRIIYTRYLMITKEEIPPEKFGEFRNFINSIAKTDREVIILQK